VEHAAVQQLKEIAAMSKGYRHTKLGLRPHDSTAQLGSKAYQS